MSNHISIYHLIDPRDKCPKYIGQSGSPRRRFVQHLRGKFDGNPGKTRWISELRAIGLEPELRIVEICGPLEADAAEQRHIQTAIDQNIHLLNISDGGRSRTRTKKLHTLPSDWIDLGNRLKEITTKLNEAMMMAQRIAGNEGYRILRGVDKKMDTARFDFENMLYLCRPQMLNGKSVFMGDLILPMASSKSEVA